MESIHNTLSKIAILVFLIFFTNLEISGQDHFTVKAKKGDGIFSLLRKYGLNNESCNFKEFLRVNDLKRNSSLKIGKSYKLPVLIYKYNGKSIRSTIGDDNMVKALRIKEYNEFLLKKHLRRKNFIESKILWVPFSDINCSISKKRKDNSVAKLVKKGNISLKVKNRKDIKIAKKKFPKIKKSGLKRYDPLFGKKYASILIEDNTLANRVFYILSGHGGPDPGAMCNTCSPKLCEDEYAYDVSLRLARDLIQHGAIVHVIVQDRNDGIRDEKYLQCDRDEVSATGKRIPINQRKRLRQRSEDVNRLYSYYKKKKNIKSQLLIVTHVDSRHKDQRIDVFFSYAKGSKTGKKMAKNIMETFDEKYSKFQKGRGYNGSIGERNWYVLRNTYPPAVFIELANIKNPKDHKRILIPTNRQAVANWIFEGVKKAY